MKPDKHFPVRTDTGMDLATWVAKPTVYHARCGYVSTEKAEFVIPWNYKPEQVTCEACREPKKTEPVG